MSVLDPFFSAAGFMLRRKSPHQPMTDPVEPRILVIRRNRLGDMICTLPLLHALRRHFPKAHLAVACDAAGAPIAGACAAVNEVIVLRPRRRWFSLLKNAARLQGFDWVIAAKGGFDRRLARLTRLTQGAIRIGFEPERRAPSKSYTDPVAPPEDGQEHQVETLLRLLQPLGVVGRTIQTAQLTLTVPAEARSFARALLAGPPLSGPRRFMLVNLSSTVRLKFGREDFAALAARVLAGSDLSVGFVAAPADQEQARELAAGCGSERVAALATPGPLELAALLEEAVVLVTPEGGAAHLAAAVGAPALILWSEGPFNKWRSRGENHVFVLPKPGERGLPLERVWGALQPLLAGGSRPRKFYVE
jgi:ADP-heptose:LPS heptosyltransferase